MYCTSFTRTITLFEVSQSQSPILFMTTFLRLIFDSEIHFFIASSKLLFDTQYLWRIGDHGIYEGYPAEITRLFNLPPEIDHVDAVYERPNKKIVFFIGRKYYVFNANNLEPGYPKPLTSLGLPVSLERIDGAMVWGHNGRTYFFSGSMYWR